jgi:TonB-linked SusC/RagA family outer membrane protein
MGKKLFISLLCLFFGLGLAWSQTNTVSGVVLSQTDDSPLAGVSVVVKGTTVGAFTDGQGRFTITGVPEGATTLQVTFIGMKGKEVPIASGRMTIRLEEDAEFLDEVVVTAQGLTKKEKAIGYSTTRIDSDKLTISRQTDLGNALAGKVSGARFFGKSGASFDAGSIVLRGTTGFNSPAGSEPIYVVDGTITNKNMINMDDVDNINVLKGPAATALYGSQGGNGAVIITTKSAKSGDGKGHVEFSHTIEMEKYYDHFDMQDKYGGGSFGTDGAALGNLDAYANVDTMSPEFLYGSEDFFGSSSTYANGDGSYYYDFYSDESWGARFDKNVNVVGPLYFDETSKYYKDPNSPWVKKLDLNDLYRTGWTNTTNVAFSKTGKDYSTRISFTNVNRTGITENSDASRRYLTFKSAFKPIDWLNISLDYKFTYYKNHNAAAEGYSGERTTMMELTQWGNTNVDLTLYKDYLRPDGTWRTWNTTSPTDQTPKFHDSPYATYNEANLYSTYFWNVVTGDAEVLLPYNIKAGFKLMGNFRNAHGEEKWATGAKNWTAAYNEWQNHIKDITMQGRVTWGDKFIDDRLTVDAAAFVEQRVYNYGNLEGRTADGLSVPGVYNLSNSVGTQTTSNEEIHYKTRSIFANVTLGFDDTYFLDGSVRTDWDSRLPDDSNDYTYGGLSASVILDRFIPARWLDFWKLRASLAQVGSTLDAYRIYPVYTTGKYGSTTWLRTPYTLRNPEIKPTISTSYEVGTEFRMFHNRLWGDINLYRRDSKNQIISVSVAPQSGYGSRQMNSGLVRNRGLEIAIGGAPVQTRNFKWTVDFNISRNINKLVRLNDDDKSMTEYMLAWSSFYNRWEFYSVVGEPVGTIYSQSYFDRNDEGKLILTPTTTASAKAYWGDYRPTWVRGQRDEETWNFQPDWTGGLSTSFSYKDFTLGASFDFVIGGDFVSWTNMWATGSGLLAETAKTNDKGVNVREPIAKGGGVRVDGVVAETDANGNVTGYKDVTTYIGASNYYHYSAYFNNSSWIFDRTYVKLRELSLSYNVPAEFLSSLGIGLSSANVSLVATNPWLVYAKCKNLDPSEAGSNWLEGGQVGSSRMFGLTIKLGF